MKDNSSLALRAWARYAIMFLMGALVGFVIGSQTSVAHAQSEELGFWTLFFQNDNVVMVETSRRCFANHLFLADRWQVYHLVHGVPHYWYDGLDQTEALVQYFACENR